MTEFTARCGAGDTISSWWIKMRGGHPLVKHFMWALHRRLDPCLSTSEKTRYRCQLLMPVLQVLTFANPGYLHFQLSLITLLERCLRCLSLIRAARLRVMNSACLLRSADIMAAVAARCNSVRETSSRYGRSGFFRFPRMYAAPFKVLRSCSPFFHDAGIFQWWFLKQLWPGITRYAVFVADDLEFDRITKKKILNFIPEPRINEDNI